MNKQAYTEPASPILPIDAPEWRVIARRQLLREAVARRDFIAVEAIYAEEEQHFGAGDGERGVYYEELARAGSLFDPLAFPPIERAGFLTEWLAARPDSYHAHLLFGSYCYAQAWCIRTEKLASEISEDRRWAIEMVCSLGSAHLLKAFALSARPALAAANMSNLLGPFGEPAWLTALVLGQHASEPHSRSAKGNPEGNLYDRALRHLTACGLEPLEAYPNRLPDGLPPRMQADARNPSLYWLRLALKLAPRWFGAITDYAYYRTARWGGEPGEIDWLATGFLASGLEERDRNEIRWLSAEDELTWNDFPDPEDLVAIEHAESIFQDWLGRDISSGLRFRILGKLANFTAFSKQDFRRAHHIHVESVRFLEAPDSYGHVDGPFRDFAHKLIYCGFADGEGAFRKVLEHEIRWAVHPTALVIAAGAYQFGWWGFPSDPGIARRLLDMAVGLAPDTLDNEFSPAAACRMIWEGGKREEAIFLTRALAEHRVFGASASMYDAARGYWSSEEDVPADLMVEKLHWLDRAVEENVPVALYNKAWRFENIDKADISLPANYELACNLYGRAAEAGVTIGVVRLYSLKLRFGPPDEAGRAMQILRNMSVDEDDEIAGSALTEIALAYKDGAGVPKSEFVAMQWVDYAKNVAPGYSGHQWLSEQIYGPTGKSMAFRGIRAFFGRKLGPEHLPQSS